LAPIPGTRQSGPAQIAKPRGCGAHRELHGSFEPVPLPDRSKPSDMYRDQSALILGRTPPRAGNSTPHPAMQPSRESFGNRGRCDAYGDGSRRCSLLKPRCMRGTPPNFVFPGVVRDRTTSQPAHPRSAESGNPGAAAGSQTPKPRPKRGSWRNRGRNIAARRPADWAMRDSNPRHPRCKHGALTS
jgi:hypothetical protein